MSVALEQMLENLKTLTEVDNLSFDEDGRMELVFDGEISLDILKISGDRVRLVAPISGSPHDLSFEELTEYLQGNYFGDATGHGAIVYDATREALLLQDEFDPALFDMKRLEARLVDFIKYTSFWLSDRSERLQSEEDVSSAPPLMSSHEDFYIKG